jgi:hypothetical protein
LKPKQVRECHLGETAMQSLGSVGYAFEAMSSAAAALVTIVSRNREGCGAAMNAPPAERREKRLVS